MILTALSSFPHTIEEVDPPVHLGRRAHLPGS